MMQNNSLHDILPLTEVTMSKARTVRFDDDIEPAVERFLEKNDLNLNKMVNLAVLEFISKPHTIELQPVNEDDWDRKMKGSYKKYKKTLDELAK
jgi:hypothetical protein